MYIHSLNFLYLKNIFVRQGLNIVRFKNQAVRQYFLSVCNHQNVVCKRLLFMYTKLLYNITLFLHNLEIHSLKKFNYVIFQVRKLK